jgi:predicted Zn-dependent protease with MMP-like domain
MATKIPEEYEAEALEQLLVDVGVQRVEDPEAALARLETEPALSRQPELRLAHADLVWELRGADAAQAFLERLVADVPDYADARHLLACVYDELGREDDKVEQFLEVLRLDEASDEDPIEAYDEQALEELIVESAESGLTRLPPEFRKRLSEVPILVEPRPSEDLVRQGFDPRALGLFEGPTHLDHQNAEASEQPTRIVLYVSNLLAECVDEDQLREEVETTVLHEVGHFFGLDEGDLRRIGLD